MLKWWMILYYPIIMAFVAGDRYLDKRLSADPAKRRKGGRALSYAFMALVSGLLIIGFGPTLYEALTRPS
jgi:hypothetical protein